MKPAHRSVRPALVAVCGNLDGIVTWSGVCRGVAYRARYSSGV